MHHRDNHFHVALFGVSPRRAHAIAGGAGVTRAIDILRCDIVRTLTLLGVASTAGLDGSSVDVPGAWVRSTG